MKKIIFIALLLAPMVAWGEGSFTGFISHDNIINRGDSATRPALLENFTDNTFGVTLKRVTNAASNYGGSGSTTFVRHEYMKKQSWNCDGTYLVMYGNNGDWFLFNGTTYEYIRMLSDVPGAIGEGPQWHPTDPDVFYFVSGNNTFSKHIVSTNSTTVLRTFSSYTYCSLGKAEGSMSIDGRYAAISCANGSWTYTGMFVYDVIDNTVGATYTLPKGGQTIDSVTMSPLGNYVVVIWNNVSAHNRYFGTEVFDRDFNYLRTIYYGVDHADVGLDTNGDEIFVTLTPSDPDAESTNYVSKFNIADGTRTNLHDISWDLDGHPSMRHANRGTSTPAALGWALVSTYSTSVDETHSYVYENEIYAVKLDGSGAVQRIVHHRSAPQYSGGSTRDYYAEPHATTNRDGSKLIWASSWRYTNPTNDSSIKEAFVIDMPTGWDQTPAAFTFTDNTSVALSTVIYSTSIQVTAIDNTTSIALSGAGCEYRVNAGSWITSGDNVVLNDNVALRVTSSGAYSTNTPCVLTLNGNVSDTWNVTTLAAVENPAAPRFKGASMSGGWR